MAVTFPAWWTTQIQEHIPKIEDVNIALFSDPINNCELSNTRCVYWLDTDEQTQQAILEDGSSYLRIVRLGGEVDFEENRDIHRVQFAAVSDDRNVSWDILAFVQRVLYAYERTRYVIMPSGAKIALEFMGETLGPLLDPQLIRDARLVSATLQLATPWPKGVDRVVKDNLGP